MLPPLYSAWIDQLLGAPVPEEPESTCDCCAMKALPGQHPGQGIESSNIHFTEPKCCTYHPHIHNFLAGRILADDSDEVRGGRTAVEQAIASGLGVTPLCITATPAYWLLYRNAAESFGRSRSLQCPLFDGFSGNCGAWRHRTSICATWFCKYEHGAVSFRFWTALRMLLQQLERSVSIHCANSLDLGDAALALALLDDEDPAPTAADLDKTVDPKASGRTWGHWFGREREFYGRCKEIAEALTPGEVLALGGAEAAALVKLTARRRADLEYADIPAGPLRVGTFEIVHSDGLMVRVCTYSAYDPLDIPVAVFRALMRFNGRPTDEVVNEIAQRDGLAMPTAVLRTLLDHELLVKTED